MDPFVSGYNQHVIMLLLLLSLVYVFQQNLLNEISFSNQHCCCHWRSDYSHYYCVDVDVVVVVAVAAVFVVFSPHNHCDWMKSNLHRLIMKIIENIYTIQPFWKARIEKNRNRTIGPPIFIIIRIIISEAHKKVKKKFENRKIV